MRDITKKDVEAHAICVQMLRANVCDQEEAKERQELINHIESIPEFFNEENQKLHLRISKSLMKRRNAIYKQLVDMKLKQDAKKLERYVYHVMEHNGNPDERVLSAKLEI